MTASPLTLSTKAGTLSKLQGTLKAARIAPMRAFTVADWNVDRMMCLSKIDEVLGAPSWIVRSSCSREDGAQASNAGHFSPSRTLGRPNWSVRKEVIASYGEAQPDDEVLVQPMLTDVVFSGVAFSHDPNTCAPYRVVNSGVMTLYSHWGAGGRVWQQASQSTFPNSPIMASVIALLDELLILFGNVPIDFEFAVRGKPTRKYWLLQARPPVCQRLLNQRLLRPLA